MKQSAYIVIDEPSLAQLCDEVNKKIAQGYRPTGGVAIQQVGKTDFFYMQAMHVKEEERQP